MYRFSKYTLLYGFRRKKFQNLQLLLHLIKKTASIETVLGDATAYSGLRPTIEFNIGFDHIHLANSQHNPVSRRIFRYVATFSQFHFPIKYLHFRNSLVQRSLIRINECIRLKSCTVCRRCAMRLHRSKYLVPDGDDIFPST